MYQDEDPTQHINKMKAKILGIIDKQTKKPVPGLDDPEADDLLLLKYQPKPNKVQPRTASLPDRRRNA